MLGSLHDAEDAVQDSLLRAWRSVGSLDERGFVRAWLYKIATNRCLTALSGGPAGAARRSRPARPQPRSAGSSPIPTVARRRGYLARESVELAFVAALQHLSASSAPP